MGYEMIRIAAARNGGFFVLTVVGARGSVPRKVGAMMLLFPDGTTAGTVGGGGVEAAALAKARDCMAGRRSAVVRLDMDGAETLGTAQICGGSVAISVDWVPGPEQFRAALGVLDAGRRVALSWSPGETMPVAFAAGTDGAARTIISDAAADTAGDARAAGEAGAEVLSTGTSSASGDRFWLAVDPPDRLLVLGGGHVGQALAAFACKLDFRVTVGDPRPEYADPSRFPAGTEVMRADFRSVIDAFAFGPASCVVVVSPGHLDDLECVRALLGREYRYAGFIGSRRKARMILDRLREEGFDPAELDRIRSPVGVDIGAETPEEIAVSILAEIIAVRRNAQPLRSKHGG
ncbi:MAG: XdhC family protein [Spirochaetes bacterium]|nr:XdhC family protein [Spirochaetota bacterium]